MKKKNVNLLWLFCDQLRYHALSCNEDPNIKTKNIDRLASEGVRFTNAISQYPICIPFRAGLITGQYAHVNGVRLHGDLLSPNRNTIAHAFRAAGYRTSWVGKWHLGGEHGIHMVTGHWSGEDYWVDPKLRGGFEDWFGFNISNHYYKTYYSHGDQVKPYELKGFQTDSLTNLSIKYLSEIAGQNKQPWFHCLSVEAPHPGYGIDNKIGNPAPPEYVSMFDPENIILRDNVPEDIEPGVRKMLAGYYSQIANIDDNIGRILDWLEETGEANNTLVVFFSDHGEMGGSQGMYDKQVVFDESVRIPVIMRMPGVLPAGETYNNVISGIDIFPTCAGLCGIPIPSRVQGIDISATLCGINGPMRNEALIQWIGKTRFGFGDHPYRAIRTRRYTYCVGRDDEFCFLFDNESDKFQMKNLFGLQEFASLQKKLHQKLCNTIIRSGEILPEFIKYRELT